jgi:hypothetical protein
VGTRQPLSIILADKRHDVGLSAPVSPLVSQPPTRSTSGLKQQRTPRRRVVGSWYPSSCCVSTSPGLLDCAWPGTQGGCVSAVAARSLVNHAHRQAGISHKGRQPSDSRVFDVRTPSSLSPRLLWVALSRWFGGTVPTMCGFCWFGGDCWLRDWWEGM